MSLIEFKDYPSTETPLNAENLNHNFNELNKDNIYSTEETFTGKYWIDGKKIFRKVLTGTLDGNEGTWFDLNLNIQNISEITSWEINLDRNNLLKFPYYESSNYYVIGKLKTDGVLNYQRKGFGALYFAATIEYTKTTE